MIPPSEGVADKSWYHNPILILHFLVASGTRSLDSSNDTSLLATGLIFSLLANSPGEDRFRVDLGRSFSSFGIFDGHGGVEVADSAKVYLPRYINTSIFEERSMRSTFTSAIIDVLC